MSRTSAPRASHPTHLPHLLARLSLKQMARGLASLAALATLSLHALPFSAAASPHNEHRVGSLKFEHMQVAETRPGQPAAGAFLKIENKGRAADRLLGVAVDKSVAARAELHTMSMEGGTMTMRQIPSLDVPADGKALLVPGGNHLMLIDLAQPLQAGQKVNVVLQFEKAGAVPLSFDVVPRNALRRESSGGHHH